MTGVWAQTWSIRNLQDNIVLANEKGAPLTSPTFVKFGKTWRFCLYPKEKELFLQLVDAPENQATLTIALVLSIISITVYIVHADCFITNCIYRK